MDTDDTWTFLYPGNSHTKPSRIRTKQFLFFQNDLWFPQHVPISDVKPTASLLTTRKTLSSSCHTWQQTEKHIYFSSVTPHTTFLPVTPFASITFAAAFVTAVLRTSLPTAFIRREFSARFCLLVPKASMHKSTCAWERHKGLHTAELRTLCIQEENPANHHLSYIFQKNFKHITGTTQPHNKHCGRGEEGR